MISRPRNLFETITELGHDLDFEPLLIPTPTAARPGSPEKVEILRMRLVNGEDLYHPNDERIAADMKAQIALADFVRAAALVQREANRNDAKYKNFFVHTKTVKPAKVKIKPSRKYPENRAPARKGVRS